MKIIHTCFLIMLSIPLSVNAEDEGRHCCVIDCDANSNPPVDQVLENSSYVGVYEIIGRKPALELDGKSTRAREHIRDRLDDYEGAGGLLVDEMVDVELSLVDRVKGEPPSSLWLRGKLVFRLLLNQGVWEERGYEPAGLMRSITSESAYRKILDDGTCTYRPHFFSLPDRGSGYYVVFSQPSWFSYQWIDTLNDEWLERLKLAVDKK
ncbi:hypothetical protein [Marinimicrobium alkaliphilum]|uniref:hypothetical protein n=1 Tax=Marinimicrobium alkaliphilum TaxID=2202654 RepID=UPI000DBAC241|nr:hypothetical protein [Marinimicrobium alkaliphilum]